MASRFTPYLKTNTSYYGPKGNLASYEHGMRLFVDGNMEYAPKVAFLYHVNFVLNSGAKALLPGFVSANGLGINEIGLLAKSASLPKFQPQVETLNRYNQKKNIQTKIVYDPVTISLHDDKKSLTSALLQAYYRYYFVDGNYGVRPYAYNPDNTYKGSIERYGLDAKIPQKHFFKEIHISQLSRGLYTRYTLVNPILSKFDHDDLDYSEDTKALQNNITINYEAVFAETGKISENSGVPDGFAQVRYDHKPSSLGAAGINQDFQSVELENAFDLQAAVLQQRSFDNAFRNKTIQDHQRKIFNENTFESLRPGNFNSNNFVSSNKAPLGGVQDYNFPKADTPTNPFVNFVENNNRITTTSLNELRTNPSALESARRKLYRRQYQENGGTGSLADADADYALRSTDSEFLQSLDSQLGL